VAYRIAVLPNLNGISLDLLAMLRDFCRAGGVLIATRRLQPPAESAGRGPLPMNCFMKIQQVPHRPLSTLPEPLAPLDAGRQELGYSSPAGGHRNPRPVF